MANYYTQSSFIVKCSQVEAKKLTDTLAFAENAFSDEHYLGERNLTSLFEHKNDSFPLGLDPGQKAFLQYMLDSGVDFIDASFGFQVEVGDEGLWFCHDESIDIDAAIACVQSFLQNFDVKDQVVQVDVAYTCSKPRTEAFGGATVFVTKNFTEGLREGIVAHAVKTALKDNVEYAFCEITETEGERESSQKFLIKAQRGSNMNDVANKICLGFRGDEAANEMDEDGNVDYGDNMMGYVNDVRPLNNQDFHIMSQYLPTING
jgi:hypothetical protein